MNICGPRIKQTREELKIKIDRSDISEIERGVRGLKDYELIAIAKILNVSPVWLLCGDE